MSWYYQPIVKNGNIANYFLIYGNFCHFVILNFQQQIPSLPQHNTTPFSLASLNYGPFGLPSFSLSPQGHSLLHFPPQLQQQEIERQAALASNSAAMLESQQQQYNAAINSGLVAIQNAYEVKMLWQNLPIYGIFYQFLNYMAIFTKFLNYGKF